MKVKMSVKSATLAAIFCLAAISPARAITAVGYYYDWVQTSGSPDFIGYLLLDASSGTGVAASTAIVSWNISGGSQTYTPGDSSILDPAALLTWGSSITSISPTLQIGLNSSPGTLFIDQGSMLEQFPDSAGTFNLRGSTVPDASNTAVLLCFGLAGLAVFYPSFLRARRNLVAQPRQ